MIGIDTNVLVRILVNDDKTQAKKAAELLDKNKIFIPKSVLLETEWVLRYTYELDSKIIFQAFEKILGLAQVTIEDLSCVKQALHWYEEGCDFADALHLASNQQISKFATFDKAFIKKSNRLGIHLMMP
jgi:predicted nucleic-acid-binding protein